MSSTEFFVPILSPIVFPTCQSSYILTENGRQNKRWTEAAGRFATSPSENSTARCPAARVLSPKALHRPASAQEGGVQSHLETLKKTLIHVTFFTICCYNYTILLPTVNLLLCTIYKLNSIIHMCRKNTVCIEVPTVHHFRHPLRDLERSSGGLGGLPHTHTHTHPKLSLEL